MIRILLCIALLLTMLPGLSRADTALVVGLPELYCPDTIDCDLTETKAIITEAYKRAGLKALFVPLPMERILLDLDSGQVDATYARTRRAIEGYDNIVQLTVPYSLIRIVAFYLDPDLSINSLADLAPLNPGIMRGDMLTVTTAKRAGIPYTLIDHIDLGFLMLKQRRVKVILTDNTIGRIFARHVNLNNYFVSEELFRATIFHTLNKKHAHLIPRLEKSFRSMLEDGTAKRLAGKYADMIPETAPE
ncbi:substrate-binding periplasmic protein [Salidesulfovibrio brasiliensis]